MESKPEKKRRMRSPEPDIGIERDSHGEPIPLKDRLPEDQARVEQVIANAVSDTHRKP